MAEEGKFFDCIIISPDRIFYEGKVEFLEMTSSEGEMGIYKEHVPTTCMIVPCVVSLYEAEGKKEAAIHAGFAEILQDKVTIMAEIAEWPDEIDENRANEARIRAERRLKEGGSQTNMPRAELALKRSLARLQLVSEYKR